jgi:hypothetical protein
MLKQQYYMIVILSTECSQSKTIRFNKCKLRVPNIQYLALIKYPQTYILLVQALILFFILFS